MNNYPIVLCHGFMGWGEGEGVEEQRHYWGAMGTEYNLPDYLRDEGYTVFYPSLGPVSGAWDRACELWAYLVGGTVDYGKVHSKKYHHARFGRTYPGVLKDWGKAGEHAKINILGHSFGGPTVMTFCSILEAGSEEERRGTPKRELSDFFKGGRGEWVHTCTTLSGVNNGTLMASNLYKFMPLSSYLLLTKFSENAVAMKDSWDMFVERWGLIGDTKSLKAKYTLYKFIKNKFDNIGYEMTIEDRHEFNKDLVVCPHTYYFARTAECTKKILGKRPVLGKNRFPLAIAGSALTGFFIVKKLRSDYGITPAEWFPSDGFVSLPGQLGPDNLRGKSWDGTAATAEAGLWLNCKPLPWDHLTWEGYGISKEEYFGYYSEMFKFFRSLPDA